MTCLHLGDLLGTTNPAEAESLLREAVTIGAKLATDYSQVPEYLGALGRSRTELALLLVGLGRPAEAPEILASAIQDLEQARAGNPREATYTRFLVEAHNDRAEALLKLARHADLALEVEKLTEVAPERPEVHVAAAKFLARALGLVGTDPALAPTGRAEVSERYGSSAVKSLRKAYEKGLEGGSTLDDPAFEPIRARKDFEKLREDIKTGIKRAVV